MIHIIMCTYQAEKYLKEQLESIEDSLEKDWILHVFDDCSTDRTLTILKDFKEKSKNEIDIVINKRNLGPCLNFLNATRVIGQVLSSDDYIMWSDQDDIWFKDKIQKTLREMKKIENEYGKNQPLLVSSDHTLIDEEGKIISISYAKRNYWNVENTDFAHFLMEPHVLGCTVMINNILAQTITMLPKMARMHDVWVPLIASGLGHMSFLKEQTMFHRDTSYSVTGKKTAFKDDLINKFKNIDKQKAIVLSMIPMLKEFREIYVSKMPSYNREILDAYIGFETNGYLKRRVDIVNYHLWKTGFLRNVGLMVLI